MYKAQASLCLFKPYINTATYRRRSWMLQPFTQKRWISAFRVLLFWQLTRAPLSISFIWFLLDCSIPSSRQSIQLPRQRQQWAVHRTGSLTTVGAHNLCLQWFIFTTFSHQHPNNAKMHQTTNTGTSKKKNCIPKLLLSHACFFPSVILSHSCVARDDTHTRSEMFAAASQLHTKARSECSQRKREWETGEALA